MNDFLRPALYNAKHNIYQIKISSGRKKLENYDIAGPICESADVLVENACLNSIVKRGDYLFIDNVGAYGATMSSTYNSRNLISEVLVRKKSFHKIRNIMTSEEFIKLEKIPNWLR